MENYSVLASNYYETFTDDDYCYYIQKYDSAVEFSIGTYDFVDTTMEGDLVRSQFMLNSDGSYYYTTPRSGYTNEFYFDGKTFVKSIKLDGPFSSRVYVKTESGYIYKAGNTIPSDRVISINDYPVLILVEKSSSVATIDVTSQALMDSVTLYSDVWEYKVESPPDTPPVVVDPVDESIVFDSFYVGSGRVLSDSTLEESTQFKYYKIPKSIDYAVSSDYFEVLEIGSDYFINANYNGGTVKFTWTGSGNVKEYNVASWSITEDRIIDEDIYFEGFYWRDGQLTSQGAVIVCEDYRIYRIPMSPDYIVESDDFEIITIKDNYYVNSYFDGGIVTFSFLDSSNTYDFEIFSWEIEKKTEIDKEEIDAGHTIINISASEAVEKPYDLMTVNIADMTSTDLLLVIVIAILLFRFAYEHLRKLL